MNRKTKKAAMYQALCCDLASGMCFDGSNTEGKYDMSHFFQGVYFQRENFACRCFSPRRKTHLKGIIHARFLSFARRAPNRVGYSAQITQIARMGATKSLVAPIRVHLVIRA